MNVKHRKNNCKLLFCQSVLDQSKKQIVQIISCFISFLLMIPLVKLLVVFLPPTPDTYTVDFIRTLLAILGFCVVFNICAHLGYKIILRSDKSEQ